MDIKDFSPLSSSESGVSYTKYIPHEQSSISSDEHSDKGMPVISEITSVVSPSSKKTPKFTRTSMVNYGPIKIRRRHTAAPTLATGRRSKHAVIEGEDRMKREIRRMKNRESARNLKKMRDDIEHELEAKITELESSEREMSTQITSLRSYKEYLEQHCKQLHLLHELIDRTASAALSTIERNRQQRSQSVPIRVDQIQLKQEPRPPSPQWQLLFSI
jgi:hypothetical protein